MRRATIGLSVWCAAAAIVGALGYLAFGPAPPTSLSGDRAGSAPEWNLPAPAVVEDASGLAGWNDVDPWGIRPTAPVEVVPSIPPAVPVGIVREGGQWHAVFLQAGVEQRASAGEPLDGGGQVRSVDALEVRWVDDEGTEHARKLLSDPVPAFAPPDQVPPEMTEDASTP